MYEQLSGVPIAPRNSGGILVELPASNCTCVDVLISAWVINEQGSGSFLGEGVVEPDSDAAVEFDVVGLEAGNCYRQTR